MHATPKWLSTGSLVVAVNAKPKAVEATIGATFGFYLRVKRAVHQDIVGLNARVGAEVPIDAECQPLADAAVNILAREVQVIVADSNFPTTPIANEAPILIPQQEEVLLRTYTIITRTFDSVG